jgi:hypothetical protein
MALIWAGNSAIGGAANHWSYGVAEFALLLKPSAGLSQRRCGGWRQMTLSTPRVCAGGPDSPLHHWSQAPICPSASDTPPYNARSATRIQDCTVC